MSWRVAWGSLLSTSFASCGRAYVAFLYQFGSAGSSRKTKMDTPHAARARKPERFEVFRDWSVARAMLTDGYAG